MNEAFPEKFVAGIVAHINEDHRAEMLAIARGLAGALWASDAELLHADPSGIDLMLRAAEREERLRVSFVPALTHPNQFRPRLITLIGWARSNLGDQPGDSPVEAD